MVFSHGFDLMLSVFLRDGRNLLQSNPEDEGLGSEFRLSERKFLSL
jgi:hypothetical protein